MIVPKKKALKKYRIMINVKTKYVLVTRVIFTRNDVADVPFRICILTRHSLFMTLFCARAQVLNI